MLYWSLRHSVVAVAGVLIAGVLSTATLALDLNAERARAATLAEALALGDQGDWGRAEALVAGLGDPVMRDIVLWRKLRAGDGSVVDYRAFVARRGTWPGQDQLARAVLGRAPGERSGPPLTGAAARNLAAFRTVYRRRDYDEAERLLDEVTVSLNGIGRPSAWADRRRRLARRAAREGRPERGYRIAAQHYLTPADGYAYADCEWIAGWIALRRLNDPARALPHFERFEAAVETPISLGRAGYWLGRTHTALGNAEAARRAYAGAAQHQTSFYGQLAAAEIGAPGDTRLAGRDLPDWRNSPGLRQDDVRMAVLLHLAGRDSLALQSFAHLGKTLDGVGQVAALGALLIDLGKPHYAVRMAKQAARRGIVLHPVYYPLHDLAEYASAVEPAFALSIARQETELNPVAVSPAGARGLMQLMPGTARKVASWIGEPYDRGRLTRDWRYNARLGQTYLARRTAQFGGSYVMAAAAYNAGAGRVDQWVGEYGDPRLPGVDLIDWMENIPFRETRNYVQRVMEGLYIYRTRLSGTAGPMTIQADLARGVRG